MNAHVYSFYTELNINKKILLKTKTKNDGFLRIYLKNTKNIYDIT